MSKLLLKLFVRNYQDREDIKVREKTGFLASLIGLITNFIIFVAKIVLGFILGLYSIVSDSINNLSDFGNNLLSIYGVKVSAKPADKEHPYGHQRMEYIISLMISCVIIALGAIMLYQSIGDFISFVQSIQSTGKPQTKGLSYVMYIVSLSLLCLAIGFKLLQAYVYFSFGKWISSMQLKALGKDAVNDCISTTLVIVGLIITWFTGYDVDCFFTCVVGVLVIFSGIGIMKEAINTLLGEKPDQKLIEALVSLLMNHKDVLGVHDLSLHTYGKVVFGVIHVEVDAKRNVMDSHELCDSIENEAWEKLSVNLTVHMDPVLIDDPDTTKYKDAVEEAIHAFDDSIHMHDFRIVSGRENVNLIFDLVIPSSLFTEKGEKEVEQAIYSSVDQKYGKNVKLVIHFDSQLTDFLSGTKAENIDR